MASTKISAMTAASALGGTEAIPGVQTAANVRLTPAQIATYVLNAPTVVGALTVSTGTIMGTAGFTTTSGVRFGGSNYGFFKATGGNTLIWGDANAATQNGGLTATGVTLVATSQYGWAAGTDSNAANDTGQARVVATVVRDTDGSTGLGKRLTGCLVEANTAGSGAPNILTAIESRTVLTNEGSTAQNYHTLPTAVAGLDFEFVVQDSDGIRVVANTADTIRDVATVSATAGFIQSTAIGSVVRLKAINVTEWIVVSKQGTWTIDS